MLKHGGGGVREGSPLASHFGKLVVGVLGRKLGSVTQRRDHGAARNIKVVRVTVELDGGPESKSKEQARVQVPDVCEDGGHSGNNSFLCWECKEPNIVGKVINYTKQVFGSPRPSLLEWAENVIAKMLESRLSPSCGAGS
jgi:hypothetical protein